MLNSSRLTLFVTLLSDSLFQEFKQKKFHGHLCVLLKIGKRLGIKHPQEPLSAVPLHFSQFSLPGTVNADI